MPKFNIVIEDTQTVFREKVFEAPTLLDAKELAQYEDWSGEGWDDHDNGKLNSGYCGISDELSKEVPE